VPIVETLYARVVDRACELGCEMPDGLAILPENFCSASSRQSLLVRAEAGPLRALFEERNLTLGSFFPAGERTTFDRGDGIGWEASLFVSAAFVERRPDAVPAALSLISRYLEEFLQNHAVRKIGLSVVVERKKDGMCRRLAYEGDAAGLPSLAGHIAEVVRR
jgi:hypothetical protein